MGVRRFGRRNNPFGLGKQTPGRKAIQLIDVDRLHQAVFEQLRNDHPPAP